MDLTRNPLFGRATMRLWAWLSLVSQILLVVTGGIVRLTGSGLGCPTWPNCTADSLVTVPAMGIHGIIEFANRLLTFALLIIALATLFAAWVNRKNEVSRVFSLAIVLVLGIPAQAVLGGFTVLTKLNPWLVGSHFVLSGILITVAAALVVKVSVGERSKGSSMLARGTWFSGWIAVVVGVLVTGAGPHAGDAQSVRNGLDLGLWQHIHSWPAYLTLGLAVWNLIHQLRSEIAGALRKVAVALVTVLSAQALIGVLQARMGLPIWLVALHLLGASLIIALLQANLSLSRR